MKKLIQTHSMSRLLFTFPAAAGAVERRAGRVIVAGAGEHAARSKQTGGAHCSTVLPLWEKRPRHKQ